MEEIDNHALEAVINESIALKINSQIDSNLSVDFGVSILAYSDID